MPGTVKLEKITTAPGSDLRQLEIQHNKAVQDLQNLAFGGAIDTVLSWSSLAANSLQALGRGSTDTAVASGAFRFIITGQAASEAKAAVTTGTAVTAQTVPADTWAVYAFDAPTGGSIAMLPGAANATTGYATEALAIAAVPPRVTVKARLGYITVKTAAGLAWIGATDALAGGATGNPASQTNYYPVDGVCAPTGVAYGPNGIVTAGGAAVQTASTTIAGSGTGSAWTGGRNGVLISAGLAIGSTDTRVANLAFTYNCNGACNIAKGATVAGTALTAATTPADKWAIFVMVIDGAGTITYLPGLSNTVTGYGSEALALGDLYKIYPAFTSSTGKALMGYVTVKTKAGTAWIAGTDAFAGGASGNPASATNYYSVQGITMPVGGLASQIANIAGNVLGDSRY